MTEALTEHVPTIADVLTVLAPLTRKGARMVEADGSYVVVAPGHRAGRQDSRRYAAAFVEAAKEKGWLQREPSTQALRLSEAGSLALRRGTDTARVPLAPALRPAVNASAPRVAKAKSALSPLSRLASKRDAAGVPLVSRSQVEAGERLARDFITGHMLPRVTANWEHAALGTGLDSRQAPRADAISDGASAAQERVRRALADAGPEFADLLIDVCCLEIGIEASETRRAWPPRTGRIILGLALDRLVRHYGIVANGPQRGRGGRWGSPGYRPKSEP